MPVCSAPLAQLRELDWSLAFAGDGPFQANAMDLAAALGIADRVSFLGMRDDVRDLLAGSDIYALISNWEGLPYGILEAVADETTGFLVPRATPEATARRLAQLIQDPALRRALGAAGRRRYEGEFRFELMYERTLAVYDSVIAARHTADVPARSYGG